MFENAMHCGPCIAAGICMPVADRNGRPAFLLATIPAQAWSDESPRIPQMAFFLKSNGALSAIPFELRSFLQPFFKTQKTPGKKSQCVRSLSARDLEGVKARRAQSRRAST